MDDYLLDFDIYHVSHVTELVMYIDAKYLSRELGEIRQIVDKRHGLVFHYLFQVAAGSVILKTGVMYSTAWTASLTGAASWRGPWPTSSR